MRTARPRRGGARRAACLQAQRRCPPCAQPRPQGAAEGAALATTALFHVRRPRQRRGRRSEDASLLHGQGPRALRRDTRDARQAPRRVLTGQGRAAAAGLPQRLSVRGARPRGARCGRAACGLLEHDRRDQGGRRLLGRILPGDGGGLRRCRGIRAGEAGRHAHPEARRCVTAACCGLTPRLDQQASPASATHAFLAPLPRSCLWEHAWLRAKVRATGPETRRPQSRDDTQRQAGGRHPTAPDQRECRSNGSNVVDASGGMARFRLGTGGAGDDEAEARCDVADRRPAGRRGVARQADDRLRSADADGAAEPRGALPQRGRHDLRRGDDWLLVDGRMCAAAVCSNMRLGPSCATAHSRLRCRGT